MVNSPTNHNGMMQPSGYRAIDVTANVPQAEAKALEQQAAMYVERFKVFRGKDVPTLPQELKLLDKRCSYLQNMLRLLRRGRRNLHIRMISHFELGGIMRCPRDSILRQEEALAELDVAIDVWVSKVEAAEERRTRIRQILLGHTTAAVTLQTGARVDIENEKTPTSPEAEDVDDDDSISTERHYAQSIEIYADEGVAALLAGIEKEIGVGV